MSTKRVYLQNNLDVIYDQEIKGDRVVIKPHDKIEMTRSKAVDIRGHMATELINGIITAIPVSLEIIPIPDDNKDNAETAEAAMVESDLLLRIAKLEAAMVKPAKLYACPYCDKDFTTREGLMTHIGRVHKEQKNDTGGHKDTN